MPKFAAKVIRNKIAGETVSVQLEVINDSQMVELHPGDEFTYISMPYDPWTLDPTDILEEGL